jgi:hypothetical protein
MDPNRTSAESICSTFDGCVGLIAESRTKSGDASTWYEGCVTDGVWTDTTYTRSRATR